MGHKAEGAAARLCLALDEDQVKMLANGGSLGGPHKHEARRLNPSNAVEDGVSVVVLVQVDDLDFHRARRPR